MALRTGKTREKRQVSGHRWQNRRSWSSTVSGRSPRSLRTPVAAYLLPDGADPPSKPRGWACLAAAVPASGGARSSWMPISTAAAAQGPLDRAHAPP